MGSLSLRCVYLLRESFIRITWTRGYLFVFRAIIQYPIMHFLASNIPALARGAPRGLLSPSDAPLLLTHAHVPVGGNDAAMENANAGAGS